MPLYRMVLLGLIAALAGCASIAAPRAPDVYVVRHLHTPAGVADPDLTAEGRAAADRLVGWFTGKALRTIYASSTKRAQQTAAPIAARRGLTVKTYNPADTTALVAAVLAERGPVLIVGHSNTVPDIVERLGGVRPAPPKPPRFRRYLARLRPAPHHDPRKAVTRAGRTRTAG